MNGQILISEWLPALSLMLGMGAIAMGGIICALIGVNEPVQGAGSERDVTVPEIVVIEPRQWRDNSVGTSPDLGGGGTSR